MATRAKKAAPEPAEPVEDVVEGDGPELAAERFTSGGEGPEGQPDTVDETASTPEG